MNYTAEQIANALDLAVLKPTVTEHQVWCACDLANHYKIKSVCVAPCNVKTAARFFNNVSTVIGFPLGSTTPNIKLREAIQAMNDGARELDVVINFGRLMDHATKEVRAELAAIVKIAKMYGALVKAILETCYLSPDEIRMACVICAEVGLDFVKTSTGFGKHGATPQAVNIIRDALAGSNVQIKASGGVSTYADAARYLDLGCTRLGSSKFRELLP